MAVSVTHTTVSGGVDDPAYDVSKNAWNEAHTVTGLGTMAEQNANNVTISGGSVTGITDLAVADGGTGGSTADDARANLKAGYIERVQINTLASPADATTYYIGCVGFTTTAGLCRMFLPRAGTIKACYLQVINAGTLGSNETSTVSIRINGSTDTTVSSAVTTDAAQAQFSNTALSISVAAGDYWELKWVSPTWATNPTNILIVGTIYVE